MKVLFLDIDGVVNCATTQQRHRGFIGIDPYMSLLVNRILEATGAKVVLSSTWRLWAPHREEVRKQVCKFIDCTPHFPGELRGKEIADWLSKHPDVEKFAILDDDSDMLPGQKLFKTSWQTGLTQEIVDQVIQYFNATSSTINR